MVGTPSLLSSPSGGLPVPAAQTSPRHKAQLFNCLPTARWRIKHHYGFIPSVARVTLIRLTPRRRTSRSPQPAVLSSEWHLLLSGRQVLPQWISRREPGRRGEPHTRLTLPRRGKSGSPGRAPFFPTDPRVKTGPMPASVSTFYRGRHHQSWSRLYRRWRPPQPCTRNPYP